MGGVVPGPIATPMVEARGYDVDGFPIGRWGEPEEVGRAIAFLASPMASYVCGVLLDVNGGLSFH
ncbi:SDR family oxidoreductase [Nocardioides sp.]|uniref:SDR family oxidoreductase n=1 Tax=Nocardioides sp. TaxID=35761 RepID=UPI0039E5DF47